MNKNSNDKMQAIEIVSPGAAGVLNLVQRPGPQPGEGEVLIKVAAAGLNRGDIMQRLGLYPPPPGASDIPGLEVSGKVVAVGAGVSEWAEGDRVCAILAGGGYAEYVVAPAVQCLALPDSLSFEEGAALPEVLFTCWTNMVEDGQMSAGKTVLIHGGSSGIGTLGIQLAKAMGATVLVTAGSAGKCQACEALGAARAINYREQDFVAEVLELTEGRGVDLVLDMVGADYVTRSLDVLAQHGRYVVIGVMKTPEATFSVAQLMRKHATMSGSTLRGRSVEEKGRIRDAIREQIWDKVAARDIVAVIDKSFPLEQAAGAQQWMESGQHIGKVVLRTRFCPENTLHRR